VLFAIFVVMKFSKYLINYFNDLQITYTRLFVPDTHRRSVANIQRFFETGTINTVKKNLSLSRRKPPIQQISSACDTTSPIVSNVTMMDWCLISCTVPKDARTDQGSHFPAHFYVFRWVSRDLTIRAISKQLLSHTFIILPTLGQLQIYGFESAVVSIQNNGRISWFICNFSKYVFLFMNHYIFNFFVPWKHKNFPKSYFHKISLYKRKWKNVC